MTIKINKNPEEIPLIIVIQSILVALFADIKPLNYALTYGGFIGEGAMSILYPVIVGAILIMSFLTKDRIIHNFCMWSVFIPVYLIGYYYFTEVFIGAPYVSMPLFLIFVVVAFYIPHVAKINVQITVMSIMILPFFTIFRMERIFSFTVSWKEVISMDSSYAYLIPIAANIIYLCHFFRGERMIHKIITVIFTAINSVIFSRTLIYGSRGPIFCVLSLVIFLWLTHVDYIGLKVKSTKALVLSVLVVLLVFFFKEVVYFLDSTLSMFGVHVRALTKIIDLEAEGDISNGRSFLNDITISAIYQKPLFGHGFDRYDANTGLLYPHNFILQIFYDGGMFLFLILSPLIIKLREKFKRITKEEYIIYSLLLFTSIPGALFSQDLWKNPSVWLFFGSLVTNTFIYKTNE